MTLEGDPVHEVERVLAAEIGALARRVIDRGTPHVEVHFREDTVVYLIECRHLPQADAGVRELLDRGVADILRRTLGRAVAGPPSRTHLSTSSRLVLLRLE